MSVCPQAQALLTLEKISWNFLQGTFWENLSRNSKCGHIQSNMLSNLHAKQISFILFSVEKGVAARSKAWDCHRSLAGILFSVPSGGKYICLLWVLCAVRYKSLCRAGHLSRGVLLSAVCLSVIVKPRWLGDPGPPGAVAHWKNVEKRKV